MSNTQFAFFKKAKIPSKDLLQSSINSLGFKLTLDPELNLLEDCGFSPCVLNGISGAGFEVSCEPTIDLVDDDETLADIAGDNDIGISMVWRSSLRDYACVLIVSCALAKDFGAVISYEGEPPESFESILQEAHEIVSEAASETDDEV